MHMVHYQSQSRIYCTELCLLSHILCTPLEEERKNKRGHIHIFWKCRSLPASQASPPQCQVLVFPSLSKTLFYNCVTWALSHTSFKANIAICFQRAQHQDQTTTFFFSSSSKWLLASSSVFILATLYLWSVEEISDQLLPFQKIISATGFSLLSLSGPSSQLPSQFW